MGWKFSHGSAKWSYNGFQRFQEKLATGINVKLKAMDGFGGLKPFSEINDPIVPFFEKYANYGSLSPEECSQVAIRLTDIVAEWPNEEPDKVQALMLVEGLREAAAAGERLLFVEISFWSNRK